MGTCMSRSMTFGKSRHQGPAFPLRESGNPPEEEKVKEVLSETPRPSVRRPKPIEKETAPMESDPCMPEKLWTADDESVDASEVTSVSERVMVVATDDGNVGEVQRPFRVRSVSGKRNGDFSGRKSPSPGRRREASPETRTYGAGGVRVVGSPTGEWRNGMRTGGSGRRSRSPADSGSRTAVNRSGSRKMAVSPCRDAITAEREHSGRLMYGEDDVCGWKEKQREMQADDGFGCHVPDETLENPLVSLECFIFL